MWLRSAFKPNVPISIKAWLLLKHTGHTLGASLTTDVPKCLIGYHRYLPLLASHRLDPCEALNLGSVCSRQLHGNMGPCNPKLQFCPLFISIFSFDSDVFKHDFESQCVCEETKPPEKNNSTFANQIQRQHDS